MLDALKLHRNVWVYVLELLALKLQSIVGIVCHVRAVVFDALKLQVNVWIMFEVLLALKLQVNVCIILDVFEAEKLHRNV